MSQGGSAPGLTPHHSSYTVPSDTISSPLSQRSTLQNQDDSAGRLHHDSTVNISATTDGDGPRRTTRVRTSGVHDILNAEPRFPMGTGGPTSAPRPAGGRQSPLSGSHQLSQPGSSPAGALAGAGLSAAMGQASGLDHTRPRSEHSPRLSTSFGAPGQIPGQTPGQLPPPPASAPPPLVPMGSPHTSERASPPGHSYMQGRQILTPRSPRPPSLMRSFSRAGEPSLRPRISSLQPHNLRTSVSMHDMSGPGGGLAPTLQQQQQQQHFTQPLQPPATGAPPVTVATGPSPTFARPTFPRPNRPPTAVGGQGRQAGAPPELLPRGSSFARASGPNRPASLYLPGPQFGHRLPPGRTPLPPGSAFIEEHWRSASAGAVPPSAAGGREAHPMSAQGYFHGESMQAQHLLTITPTHGEEIVVPVDTHQASKLATEKRQRNAGASARFRDRKKAKERAMEDGMHRLEAENRELKAEIRRLRDIIANEPGLREHVDLGPSSPGSSRSSGLYTARSAENSPGTRRVEAPQLALPSPSTSGPPSGVPPSTIATSLPPPQPLHHMRHPPVRDPLTPTPRPYSLAGPPLSHAHVAPTESGDERPAQRRRTDSEPAPILGRRRRTPTVGYAPLPPFPQPSSAPGRSPTTSLPPISPQHPLPAYGVAPSPHQSPGLAYGVLASPHQSPGPGFAMLPPLRFDHQSVAPRTETTPSPPGVPLGAAVKGQRNVGPAHQLPGAYVGGPRHETGWATEPPRDPRPGPGSQETKPR